MFAKLLYAEVKQLCELSSSEKLLLAAVGDEHTFAGTGGCVRFVLTQQLLREHGARPSYRFII